jgi:hypothetical protein
MTVPPHAASARSPGEEALHRCSGHERGAIVGEDTMFATLEAPSFAQDMRIECARGSESLYRPYVFDIQLFALASEAERRARDVRFESLFDAHDGIRAELAKRVALLVAELVGRANERPDT